MKMKRLKIGIRPQLIILVCFSSLFSLLILGIVTGVYFSSNLSHLRAERLEVISKLKSTQVIQSIEYVYYQIYWLTTKDSIYAPLSSYRAGNNTKSIFSGSSDVLDLFLASSELFAAARLYDMDLNVMSENYNNDTIVSNSTLNELFPLDDASSLTTILSSQDLELEGYISGPLSNTSDPDSAFFMGITLPVYANSSVILSVPSIAGYLTIIANAKNIQIAINDTSTIVDDVNYTVTIVKPTFKNNQSSLTDPSGYEAVFPVKKDGLVPNHIYDIDSSDLIKEALTEGVGSSGNVKSYNGKAVAIGYTQIQLGAKSNWSVIVEQPRSEFLTPVVKLRNIIIGVVIGTGVLMCLITFPLAVWFIGPITKLKEATESITRSKKKKQFNEKGTKDDSVPPSYNSIHPNSGSSSKRNSVYSELTNSSSIHSTAIRLPTKIQSSKKFFKDELTELSDAFNIMTEELDKQYTHLEDRVKIRTKELEALKIEAESANEAKTVFIANISHELRTPLNGILGMTAIAMDEHDPSRIQESLRLIYRSGELLLHILTELLTYSKNTLNRSKLEKSNFQILEVVYQVQSIFSKLAMDQRVNMNIFLKPDIIRKLVLYGDSNRIIQIVMNLVSNSLKFTPVDGSVDVSFKLLGEYDQENSEKEGFKKVHILKSLRKSSANGSLLFKKHAVFDEIGENADTIENNKDKLSSNKSSSFSEKDKTFDTNNDSSSILTLSTVEYENAIFNSQFNHDKQKNSFTYRRPSRMSGRNSIEKIEQINPTNSQNITNKNRSIDNTILNPIDFNGASSIGSSKDEAHSKSYTTAISDMATDRELLKFSATSSSSNLSVNELIKDDKRYKIRKLYEPKTWVIQIEVSDTGPGIEPAMQEKVFDPFIQGDQTLSRSYGGTGLGLSICRQLAEMMNGTLTLKSTVGLGSTFTFTVPLPQSGEIMVDEEDMPQFCEDEFNPKSRINRKVAFDIEPEKGKSNISGVSLNTSNSSSKDMQTPNGQIHMQKNESFSEYESREQPFSNAPTHIDIIKTISNSDNLGQSKEFEEPKASKLSNGIASDVTTPNPEKKRNLEPETGYFDAPHLLTKSSTGTANSVISEVHDSPTSKENEFSHLKILVAEDNMVNQEVIRRMLKLEGFTNITMACNGAEVIELVENSDQNYYDLILMDVQMPKVDGLLATKRIRNDLQYTNPIIALTAFADEGNVKECLSCGMSGFLAKPIRRSNLKTIITEFRPELKNDSL